MATDEEILFKYYGFPKDHPPTPERIKVCFSESLELMKLAREDVLVLQECPNCKMQMRNLNAFNVIEELKKQKEKAEALYKEVVKDRVICLCGDKMKCTDDRSAMDFGLRTTIAENEEQKEKITRLENALRWGTARLESFNKTSANVIGAEYRYKEIDVIIKQNKKALQAEGEK